jgi:hypothetical protein
MPRYDRTGPMGAGAGTGRGMGYCGQKPGLSAFASSGIAGAMFRGRGLGRGGQGRCFGLRGWWLGLWASSQGPTEEAQTLKSKISSVKAEIAAMEARLAELEKRE